MLSSIFMGEEHSSRRQKASKFLISTFDFWLLLSTFFTTAGSIVILYAPSREGVCRRGVEIAAVTLQGIAVLFALFSMVTAALTNTRNNQASKDEPNSKSEENTSFSLGNVTAGLSTTRLSSKRPIIQGCIIIVINVVTLIMAVIILVTGDCENFIYNAVYNIFGVVGSLFINVIQAFEIQRHVVGSAFYYDDDNSHGTDQHRQILSDFVEKVEQLNNRSLPSEDSGKNPQMNSSDEQIRAEVVHETK